MASYDDTATVSGSVVSFSNGADDVPLKSCEVTLPASLDGYSSVDMVHCGKNILNGEDAVKTANNIRFYYGNGKYYHAGTYTLSISESVSGIYVRNVSTSANIFVKYSTNFITFTLTEQTLISFDFYKVGINQDDNVMLEVGSTASTFEPYSSSVYTVNLGRTIYGGAADVVKGTGTDENGDDFTFEPVEISSRLGNNTMWSEQGNIELTYYKSGYGFTSVTVHKETPDGEPVVQTVKLHRIVYEGEVDAVRGTGKVSIGESGTEYDPPETFTFEPISISTDEGENTLFANEGDSSITYRKAVD